MIMNHLLFVNRLFFKISFVIVISVFVNVYANAKCWRINDDVAKKAHFVSINAAMDSENVLDGDTLYIDPGAIILGTQKVTKQVAIIGCGYFLRDYPYQQSCVESIYVTRTNVVIKSLVISDQISLGANNVSIERCKIRYINGCQNHITVRQCYVYYYISSYSTGGFGSYWTIENNIMENCTVSSVNSSTIRNNYIKSNTNNPCLENVTNSTITNNIIFGSIANYVFKNVTGLILNNILSCDEETYSALFSSSQNNSFNYNMCLGSNNENAIFAMEGFDDQLYRLKEGSPAKDFGEGGADCGPYGGAYIYVPSGIINRHPYFKEIDVAPLATDGKINVSLKVKMQDE